MPTFATPDPGVIDRPYVEQIPLDALFRGLGYKQQQYDQSYQQLQSQVDSIAGMQGYGPDQQALDQIKENLNKQLPQFAGQNLRDPGVQMQLQQLISNTGKAIADTGALQRASEYNKAMQFQKEADLKGRKTFDSGLDKLQQYYTSNKFDPKFRAMSDPGVIPDYEKALTTLHTVLEPDVTNVPDGHGGYIPVKSWDPKKSKTTLGAILEGTDHNKYQKYLFDQQTSGIDWSTYPQTLKRTADYTRQLAEIAHNRPGMSDEGKSRAIEAYQQAQEAYESYNKLSQNPYAPQLVRQRALSDHMDQSLDHLSAGSHAVQQGQILMSKFDELNKELSNSITETDNRILQETRAKAGLLKDPKTGQELPAVATRGGGKPAGQIDLSELEEIAKNPDKFASGKGSTGGTQYHILDRIPGIFNTDVFDRSTKTSYTRDEMGNVTSAEKIPEYPHQVTFDPITKKFRVYYGGGKPTEYYTVDDVRNKIGIKKPSLEKNLVKTPATTTTPAAPAGGVRIARPQ